MDNLEVPDGRTLELALGGADDGPVLLFHHGTPGGGLALPEIDAGARRAGLRLLTWSRPGYAGSTRQPGRRVADVVADAAALLDHVGAGDCFVAGWSGGGPHALACAALMPERVRGTLVIAGVAPHDADGLKFVAGMGEENVEEFGAAVQGEEALRRYLDEAGEGMDQITGSQMVDAMSTLLPPADVEVLGGGAADHLAAQMRDGLRLGTDGWLDDDLAFVAPWGFDPADVAGPVHLWQGSEDLMVPLAHGRWLAEHLPGAELHLKQGEGHISLPVGPHLDRMLAGLVAD